MRDRQVELHRVPPTQLGDADLPGHEGLVAHGRQHDLLQREGRSGDRGGAGRRRAGRVTGVLSRYASVTAGLAG